jgi:glycerol-3-phosphate dehydrogenase (NAD+)
VEEDKIRTFPSVISSLLDIRCSALGGANIAGEGTICSVTNDYSQNIETYALLLVAKDNFCESTLGIAPEGMKTSGDRLSDSDLWFRLFDTPTFRIRMVQDVEGVALCGGLKSKCRAQVFK